VKTLARVFSICARCGDASSGDKITHVEMPWLQYVDVVGWYRSMRKKKVGKKKMKCIKQGYKDEDEKIKGKRRNVEVG
jgi:hypothetical protein